LLDNRYISVKYFKYAFQRRIAMDFDWTFFIDVGLIGLALLFATFLRAKIRFFQRFLIPNALTAGFILLPVYNFVLPAIGLGVNGLGELVYHLLNISFIAMTLRKSPPKANKGNGSIFATSVAILSQYAIQALTGLLLTFLFIKTIAPGLFPAFGFALPLGFALGPGQAFAIGQGWESFGFKGGSSVGLTFAALGYLWACFGGIFLINYGIKKDWMSEEGKAELKDKGLLTGVLDRNAKLPVGSRLTTDTEAIDSLSYHVAMVLFVYLLSYLFLKGLTFLLSFAGKLGTDLATNLWGINFIFSTLTALVVKAVLKAIKVDYTLDNETLSRISGFSVDFMVAGSIAAISLVFVSEYWLPIVIASIIGGILTTITVPWICSRIFVDNRFARMLMIYGVSTGTLSTGLAVLRVVDPEFKTPVASDYSYSAGLTFVFAIPFILAINLPAYAVSRANMLYFWLAVAVSAGYLLFVIISYFIVAKKRGYAQPRSIWLLK